MFVKKKQEGNTEKIGRKLFWKKNRKETFKER